MGTPRVGGPYSLTDHYGNKVTQDTYAGKHTLVFASCDMNDRRYILDSLDVRIFVLRNWIRWLELSILSTVKDEIHYYNHYLSPAILIVMTLLLSRNISLVGNPGGDY